MMLSKLVPVVFLLAGMGAGGGVAVLLEPEAPPDAEADGAQPPKDKPQPAKSKAKPDDKSEFVKLNNQFVVPVVAQGRVAALVVVSLSLETDPGLREAIYEHEPKLRALFLQVMFDHANMGGFAGAFTQSDALEPLRDALREVAISEMGDQVRDVLLVGIARQDS